MRRAHGKTGILNIRKRAYSISTLMRMGLTGINFENRRLGPFWLLGFCMAVLRAVKRLSPLRVCVQIIAFLLAFPQIEKPIRYLRISMRMIARLPGGGGGGEWGAPWVGYFSPGR